MEQHRFGLIHQLEAGEKRVLIRFLPIQKNAQGSHVKSFAKAARAWQNDDVGAFDDLGDEEGFVDIIAIALPQGAEVASADLDGEMSHAENLAEKPLIASVPAGSVTVVTKFSPGSFQSK
jgi:hypothetical protein